MLDGLLLIHHNQQNFPLSKFQVVLHLYTVCTPSSLRPAHGPQASAVHPLVFMLQL